MPGPAFAVAAGDQELQPPRLGRPEALAGADDEEGRLAQLGRARHLQLVEPDMVLARKRMVRSAWARARRSKRAAPDPGGAFERIAAASGDEQEVVVRAEPGREPGERLEPDEVATDPGRRGEADEQLDEQARRVARGIAAAILGVPGAAVTSPRLTRRLTIEPSATSEAQSTGSKLSRSMPPGWPRRPLARATARAARRIASWMTSEETVAPLTAAHGAFAAAAPHLDGSRSTGRPR